MQIQLEVNPAHVDVLSAWASVSRTFDVAIRVIEELLPEGPIDPDACVAMEELTILQPVLDSLHQTVRGKIWKKQDEITSWEMREIIACDSEIVVLDDFSKVNLNRFGRALVNEVWAVKRDKSGQVIAAILLEPA